MKKKIFVLLVLILMLTCAFAQNVFAEAAATDEFICDCPTCNPTEEAEDEMPPMDFKFDVRTLGSSALIMGKGMLGIAIVTAIIIAIVMLLNRITSDKKNN